MNNPEQINIIALKEYVDTAQTFYTLLNVNIQQYDGILDMSSGLPSIEIQKHYLENPKRNDQFRKMMLDRFNYLAESADKIYSIIEKSNLSIKDEDIENSVGKILKMTKMIPILKKTYFGQPIQKVTDVKNYETIDMVDEIIRLDKETIKMQNIFAGLNTYSNN
jgi:hypothetical protein